ncbi:MAG TPA: YggT family protein [Sphingomicrobium sp.]|nr:YggT family protein [Sphingomicrobium sp.]
MIHALFQISHYLLNILFFVIIVQFVLSWLVVFNVINVHSPGVRAFVNAVNRVVEPLYRPIRRLLPDFGGIDFSPVVVIILIQIAHMLLSGAERSLLYGGA